MHICIYILIAPSSQMDQPTMTSSTPIQHSFNASGNGSGMKNGSGSVLHRVITLTTADSNLSSSRTLSKPPIPPTYVTEKLHFSAYEKFEGNCKQHSFRVDSNNETMRKYRKSRISTRMMISFDLKYIWCRLGMQSLSSLMTD
jgi:hypothetical protein